MSIPAETAGWTRFDRRDWPVTLHYPDPTPGGRPVRIDEHFRPAGYRFHFISEGSNEIYFEVGRYPGDTVETAMAVFEDQFSADGDRARVGEPERVVVARRPALRFEVRWPEKRRWIHFLDVDGITHRVILDPDSALNFAILNALNFE